MLLKEVSMHTVDKAQEYAAKVIQQHIKQLATECRRLPRKYRWRFGEQIEQLKLELRLLKRSSLPFSTQKLDPKEPLTVLI
jgi:hypothetical protein